MEIKNCTMDDFNEIVRDITDFWGSDRTLHLHQPFLVYEFGNTAFAIKEKGIVVAYLFGFYSQTESLAYVHLLGVREQNQRQGLGKLLYDYFIEIAKARGISKIKAITTPSNIKSVNFHKSKIGMNLIGEPNQEGINVVRNYSGINNDRVVFEKKIS
ncbi:MAG TPA: GNAT family N-acetyltransferase [Paludibacter sp.]|nr:GNAT family N-acetyltransferase [Paludibacter sp.]